MKLILLHEADEKYRELERRANAGDPEAHAAMERYWKRMGLNPIHEQAKKEYENLRAISQKQYETSKQAWDQLSDQEKQDRWGLFINYLTVRGRNNIAWVMNLSYDLITDWGLVNFKRNPFSVMDLEFARNSSTYATAHTNKKAIQYQIPIEPFPSFEEYKKESHNITLGNYRIGPKREKVDFETWMLDRGLPIIKVIVTGRGTY